MRNFTAIFADLTPEEIAEIMANPKCRFGSHSDLAAERAAMADEIERLKAELEAETQRRWEGNRIASSEAAEELAASQAREAKLREALK
jgi:hypothetical protein